MKARLFLYAAAACLFAAPIVSAQDAVKVDPKHYTVVSENDQIRILRAHYGPHEKSVMHSHPSSVIVPLTDGKTQFTLPGGKKEDASMKAGEARFANATTHLPENMGDTANDVIVIELKGKAGAHRAMGKPTAKAEAKK